MEIRRGFLFSVCLFLNIGLQNYGDNNIHTSVDAKGGCMKHIKDADGSEEYSV